MMTPSFDIHRGLTAVEASLRLAQYGPNEIAEASKKGALDIVLRLFREPMIVLLFGAAAIYLFLGSLGEGIFLLAGAMLGMTLVLVQELRSERALQALRSLAAPLAHVVRDGVATTIPVRDIVPGDLLTLEAGDRVAADGVLVGGDPLGVDESALTGEAIHVTKCAGDSSQPRSSKMGTSAARELHAGTLVVSGQAPMIVTRTGTRSQFGAIGASLSLIDEEQTLLQRQTGRLIRRLGVMALVFCATVAIAYGWTQNDWVAGSLAGVTLAISLIPEELPLVLTIVMAIGATAFDFRWDKRKSALLPN